MALASVQPVNVALIRVATQGSADQQTRGSNSVGPPRALRDWSCLFPRRHYAIALRVGMDGARETDVVRSVRGFSSPGIWVRPPYEGRHAQVAPQIRPRLPAGFAHRRKSGSLS